MTQHKTLFKMLDKSYNLCYVDYRDKISDDKDTMKKVEEAIQTQDWYHLDEAANFDEWLWDNQYEGVKYIINETLHDELSRMDLPESFDIDEYLEKHFEDIQIEIENRDISNPLEDLLRNTSDIIMFYDLDVDINSSDDEEDYQEYYKAIKKALKIKKTDYKKQIDSLLANAYHGGMLRIFFSASIEDMMKLADKKKITFKNPEICIHDSWNGSGDNENFTGLEITLPFDIKNLRVEKAINGYTYTDEICGMSHDWADDTQVNFK